MMSISLQDGNLQVAQGPEPQRPLSLSLNTLRKVFLFMPKKYTWHCAPTTVGHSSVNLDDLSDDDLADLLARLSRLKADRARFNLFLENYLGRCVVLSLAEIDGSGIDLLAELGQHRQERRQRVADWTKHGPGLVITGALGDNATLGPQGVRKNPGPLMAWKELDRVEVESDAQAEHDIYRFVPKPGSASSAFTVRMPAKKAESFMAEYTFWHSLALRQTENHA